MTPVSCMYYRFPFLILLLHFIFSRFQRSPMVSGPTRSLICPLHFNSETLRSLKRSYFLDSHTLPDGYTYNFSTSYDYQNTHHSFYHLGCGFRTFVYKPFRNLWSLFLPTFFYTGQLYLTQMSVSLLIIRIPY